jgi:hypothetical protein
VKLIDCQCARRQGACTRTATQEDFLCDVCRDGWCGEITYGPDWVSQVPLNSHVDIRDVKIAGIRGM